VHHHVDEVHQDPIADAPSFDVLRLQATLPTQAFLDRIRDRENLAGVRAVTDDEVVCEIAQPAKIEN
jgi:hypothetical protein